MVLANRGLAVVLVFCCFYATPSQAEDAPAKIQVGQTWTYDESDLITNAPTQNLTWAVTEAGDKTYTLMGVGTSGGNILDVDDHNGNVVQHGAFTYSPNDASGLPEGAKAGTTWKKSFTWRNSDKGGGGKADANGQCTGNEHVTVAAGSFDALKCEVDINYRAGGAAVVLNTHVTTWYAPETLRFVKRDWIEKLRGHVSQHKVQELTNFNLNP